MAYSFLKDLFVLELANVLAGPSVGQFLAECGAEVLKIENPATGGDVTRSWKLSSEPENTPRSAYFCAANWGKKSKCLNLKQEEDYQELLALIRRADILLVSYKPGDAERLKVDYETLQKENPRLIYASISGYGAEVPRVGYDAILQAETGFSAINGAPNTPPTKMPVALVDVLANHHLREGILLALLQRERTGKGEHVQVSLRDAALSSLANQATNWLVAGHNPRKMGSEHPNIAPYGRTYTTRDDKQIILAVGTDKQFAALCKILGITLHEDEAFRQNAMRVKKRRALNEKLEESIKKQDSQGLLEKLHAQHIPAGLVRDVAEALETPHGNQLHDPKTPNLRGIRTFVAEFNAEKFSGKLSAPPRLGEE